MEPGREEAGPEERGISIDLIEGVATKGKSFMAHIQKNIHIRRDRLLTDLSPQFLPKVSPPSFPRETKRGD